MFGAHTPYIIAAYGVSFVLIAGLIVLRLRNYRKAKEAAKRQDIH
ncbi:heme exporter protein CcmD [Hyphococcus sp. DH-69]